MEIVEGEVDSGVGMDSETVVAETPLEDQQALNNAGSVSAQAEAVSETPPAVGLDQIPDANASVPTVPVGAPVRSYLDTVVGRGTGTAPFLLAESGEAGEEESDDDLESSDNDETEAADPTKDVEPDETHQANGRAVATGSGVAAGRTMSPSVRPYGPWMIATRRERRQQERPAGQGRPTAGHVPREQTGRHPENNLGNGSRFALLRNEEETEGQDNQTDKDTSGDPQVETRTTGLGGKSRRANVIANEKQIQNDVRAPHCELVTGKEPTQGRRATGSSSRRAAEEDEHVVSRGVQGGKVVSTTVVHNGDDVASDVPVVNQTESEHHGDPPGAFDEEGDVIMDMESQQQAVADDGVMAIVDLLSQYNMAGGLSTTPKSCRSCKEEVAEKMNPYPGVAMMYHRVL
nr:uncharacterized protein LOC109156749 [Ipomoea batatas]